MKYPGYTSYDPRWWFLLLHKFNVPRIAKLTGKLCHAAAGDTDEIDMLQLWPAYMAWILSCLTAVLADVGLFDFNWVAKVPRLFCCLATGFAHVNLLCHGFLLLLNNLSPVTDRSDEIIQNRSIQGEIINAQMNRVSPWFR